MMFSVDTQKLLALHYVYPLPLQKLQQLQSPVDVLDHLDRAQPSEIAQALHLSLSKATQLLQGFLKAYSMPLEEAYASMDIPLFLFIILYIRRIYLNY